MPLLIKEIELVNVFLILIPLVRLATQYLIAMVNVLDAIVKIGMLAIYASLAIFYIKVFAYLVLLDLKKVQIVALKKGLCLRVILIHF